MRTSFIYRIIENYERRIVLMDGTWIPIQEVIKIDGELFRTQMASNISKCE